MALSEAEGLGSLIWSGLKRGQPANTQPRQTTGAFDFSPNS